MILKGLDLLFREGIEAEMCNPFPLGRTLDEVYAYFESLSQAP